VANSFRKFQENFAAIDFSKEIVLPEPKRERLPPARSDLPCPRLASDNLDQPVQCQATGVWHDSKSALRKGYKAAGVIEKGNDRRPPWKMPRSSRKEIRDTVAKARARVERGERNIYKGK
jgi:hypothetical protein